MPITIYGDGFITGLGNVSVSSNVAVGNITLTQNNLLGSVSTNGWQRLPSGLIMQWGRDTKTGADHGVMFPIPFPNAVFSVTSTGYAGGTNYHPFHRNANVAGFQQNFYSSTGSSGAATSWEGHWMAVGY
jgi:hypothetical protein